MKHLLNTLYVTTPQSFLRLENGNVVIEREDEETSRIPLHLIEGMVLFGALGMTPALMGECIQRGIRVTFLGMNGNFLARLEGNPTGNVLLRREQFRWSDDPDKSLLVAKRFVLAKVRNQRTVVARFMRDHADVEQGKAHMVRDDMDSLLDQVRAAETRDQLMGVEGKAADCYFSMFGLMIRSGSGFTFEGRSRRPPRDETNALLSFFYTLLAHDVAAACNAVGLDPYVGFLHTDRPGRTSLALDLMEELRPYVVDRFVLDLINRGQTSVKDYSRAEGGVTIGDSPRRKLITLWQKRKQEEITHPFLGEKIAIGLIPFVQAQLLAKYVRGEQDNYPAFLWR